MVTQLIDKSQVRLPDAVLRAFADVEYFEVMTDGVQIVLTPVQMSQVDKLRAKLDQLGLTEQDITAAVKWARVSQTL